MSYDHHPASKVYNRARTRALRDLRLMWPGEYRLLYIAADDELSDRPDWRQRTAKQRDSARRHRAETDLKEIKARYFERLLRLHQRVVRWQLGLPTEGLYAYEHGVRVSSDRLRHSDLLR